MERYRSRKPQLVTAMTIFSVLLGASLTVIIIRTLDKLEIQNQIDDWYQKTISALECSQICPLKPFPNVNELCCDSTMTKCFKKQLCFDESIATFEDQIESDNMAIIYSIVPACIFSVLIVVLIIHWYRLRKYAKQETRRRALQEALINHQEENIEYNFEEESFQSYDEFIQYLIDSGYIIQQMDLPHKRRVSSKIKDSFDTVDNENCPICIQEYSEEKVLSLDCEHKFHSQCIRDWNSQNPSCPICRANIEE